MDYSDGTFDVFMDTGNLFMTGYLGPNLYIRPSCGNCHFKALHRYSDITLADFWGVIDRLDDDQGTSLILVNSAKGQQLLISCANRLFLEERSLGEISDRNVCFDNSVVIHPASEKFLKSLDTMKFSIAQKQFLRKPLSQRIKLKFINLFGKKH